MWRKVIPREDLAAMQQQLEQALHQLEVAFPCQMMYVKTHNTVHTVEKIRLCGPLYINVPI
jgi:hypothetical protein